MVLTISPTGTSSASSETTTENALPPSPNFLDPSPIPLFKLISEDILVDIFSWLEGDPRHLARLACVCRIFANVVRNVCWKRQCIRIVPEIMPSPQTHLDQIPEPPGGWGALMKLLVCCPGLKHAGIVPACCDFGFEREIGPTELYEIQPRYVPKRRIEVDNAQRTGGGELTTVANGDAFVCVFGTGTSTPSSSRPLIAGAAARDSAVQSGPASNDSSVGLGLNVVTEKAQVKDGESSSKESLSTGDLCVRGGGRDEVKDCHGDPRGQCNLEVDGSLAGLREECLIQAGQVGMSGTVTEDIGKSLVTNPPSLVDVVLQETQRNDISKVDPPSVVKVQGASGRPPRRPIKRVHWNEEELASKAEKVVSKCTSLGETAADRARSRKRKERALRRILAKVPEDPKQRLHIVIAEWTLPREEGSRLLASRFRSDGLYICDWPGCVHPGERRNYKLFRGFFKNFKSSLLWRNLKDMNAKKTNISCAFCSSTFTWDMMTAFCLRRSFEYHDDGEPVVHASVCENGHVSGAWTDRPRVFAAR